MADAQIIPFPSVKRCSECEWAAFSVHGIFCLQLHEEILNETWAQECELFDPVGAPASLKES